MNQYLVYYTANQSSKITTIDAAQGKTAKETMENIIEGIAEEEQIYGFTIHINRIYKLN